MNATARVQPSAERQEGRAGDSTAPHLSFSRVNRYLVCPEQYRLYYVEGMRPRLPAASLIFGQNVHLALAHHFSTGEDPAAFFEHIWAAAKEMELRYAYRESWERLAERGTGLLTKFMSEERSRLSEIAASEKSFELAVTSLNESLVGIIDLVAKLDGKKTVVDFKTASAAYAGFEVELSDQLTAYQLAEPDAVQTALCVLVKTKEPKIEWHLSRRTGDQLVAFLRKVGLVGQAIRAGHFYKRPDRHCAWCDFLPVCLGDTKRAEQTLFRVIDPH